VPADGIVEVHIAGTGGAARAEHEPGRPVFYYDLASPESWLVAERAHHVLGVVPVWEPVALGPPAFRCAAERDAHLEDLTRALAAHGLQSPRWPASWPGEARPAMLAATYAQRIGKVVAFSLAAFRQAYAGGRDLGDPETALIAGAACEIAPRAILKALETRGVADGLEAATAAARAAGVARVPAIGIGARVFHGCEELDAAAVAVAEARA